MACRSLPVLGLLSLCFVLVPVAHGDEILSIHSFRAMDGDDPAWSDAAFDDSDWPELPLGKVRSEAPVFWLRSGVVLNEPAPSHRPVAVRFLALASCDLFWNGRLLGSKGVVGVDRSEERPGELDWLVALPSPVEPGRHSVALRCSAHHRGFDPYMGFYAFWIGDYLELAQAGRSHAVQTLLSAGGLAAIGLYYVLIFVFGTRSRSQLWLGLFASAGGALVIVESLRALVGYTYDWHVVRLRTIAALTLAINGLLLLFVSGRFPIPSRGARGEGKRLTFLAGTGLLLLLCLGAPGYDAKSALLFLVGLGGALAWTVWAMIGGRSDAVWAVAGIGLCLAAGIWQQAAFLDYYLLFGLTLLCVFLLIAHVRADARERREFAAMELRSARLEIELLRRHLQPHFLMNSLTALAEWFEEEPEVASEMMQDLGRELRILSDVSRLRLIPFGQELELCRTHLAVMARRRDESLELDVSAMDPEAPIPPAVIHTLLENALTHNAYGGAARFSVRQRLKDDRWQVIFDAPLVPRKGSPGDRKAEGTGLKYVRARLRESFGDDFELEGGLSTGQDGDSVWRTMIRYPRAPVATEPPPEVV